jgi:hypothetical protein
VEDRRDAQQHERGLPHAVGPSGAEDELRELATALEGAGDLPLDERLALLRRTEEAIARSLEGLDGL